MKENNINRFLEFDKSLINVDYVCGMEYREEEKKCYVYLTNSHYARQAMTCKKYKEFQQKFIDLLKGNK